VLDVEQDINRRQAPDPNRPMARMVVGLKVSPSLPLMMFPAAYVAMKIVSISDSSRGEYPADVWSCCFTVEYDLRVKCAMKYPPNVMKKAQLLNGETDEDEHRDGGRA
jgi:hypothetical protein